jgi:hypothetical protein
MKVAAIHQPQYLPYLGYFHKLARADVFIELDTVQFQKNGLQNRNKIKGAKGWQWLTVPVSHGHDSKILDVQIGDPGKWARKHWSTLQSNYGRAPRFAWAAELLRPVFETPWTHLSPLNIQLGKVACELLAIKAPHILASELASEGESSTLLISLCKAVGADAYLSGPGGRGYMDLELFERAGIQVLWQSFEHPTYPQLFPEAGFVPNLSIVDVLFQCGEAARSFVAP